MIRPMEIVAVQPEKQAVRYESVEIRPNRSYSNYHENKALIPFVYCAGIDRIGGESIYFKCD